MECFLLNLADGSRVQHDLPDAVFSLEPRYDIIHRVVNWQLAKRRSGNHFAKGRSDVTASGKKIYAQKGTGGARHSSRKVNLFRGGGVTFGPVVRSHETSLPKAVRFRGLYSAVLHKMLNNQFFLVEDMEFGFTKTVHLAAALKKSSIRSVLFVDSESRADVLNVSSNIPTASFLPLCGMNVYDILSYDNLLLSKAAFHSFEAKVMERYGNRKRAE